MWNAPKVPKAALFTSDVERRALVVAARLDPFELGGIGEVGAEHLGLRAVGRFQLLGERLEATLVACDEHDVVTALGEDAGERFADTRGRAGDESDMGRFT